MTFFVELTVSSVLLLSVHLFRPVDYLKWGKTWEKDLTSRTRKIPYFISIPSELAGADARD